MDLPALAGTPDGGRDVGDCFLSEVVWRRESWADIEPDIVSLLPQHHKELALYQDDIALEPDFSFYTTMDEAGRTCVVAGRQDGRLVGYAIYFTRNHPHYKSVKWAVSDVFWLHPDYRRFGHGRAMFDKVEEELKKMGVAVLHTTFKTDHPAAGSLLAAMGHTLVEQGYSKKIG
jgi:GNAT superfamily N-acetyltransferase